MTAVRYIFLFGFSAVLFSCGQSTSTKDKPAPVTDPCHFEKYLNDPHTPDLAKKIFLNENWDLNDDNVLSFFDSVMNKNNESRLFYFKVVANSYQKADGYYSEGLGAFGKEFVENNTREFLSFFDNDKCLGEKELNDWANIVMLEISLLASDLPDSLLRTRGNPTDGYIDGLNKNCIPCTGKEKAILVKFTKSLKQKWQDYVKLAGE